jgi:hypothetical protein
MSNQVVILRKETNFNRIISLFFLLVFSLSYFLGIGASGFSNESKSLSFKGQAVFSDGTTNSSQIPVPFEKDPNSEKSFETDFDGSDADESYLASVPVFLNNQIQNSFICSYRNFLNACLQRQNISFLILYHSWKYFIS